MGLGQYALFSSLARKRERERETETETRERARGGAWKRARESRKERGIEKKRGSCTSVHMCACVCVRNCIRLCVCERESWVSVRACGCVRV